MNAPKVRVLAAREWPVYKNLRLRCLADSPDAFGTTLAEEQETSDAAWSSRLASGIDSDRELPLVAEVDGEPVGLAWCRIDKYDPKVASLHHMWVAPDHRRLGVGRLLVETAIAWARSQNAYQLELGVTFRDSPAIHLYKRAGFEPLGEPEPWQPGSRLLGQQMRLELETRIPE